MDSIDFTGGLMAALFCVAVAFFALIWRLGRAFLQTVSRLADGLESMQQNMTALFSDVPADYQKWKTRYIGMEQEMAQLDASLKSFRNSIYSRLDGLGKGSHSRRPKSEQEQFDDGEQLEMDVDDLEGLADQETKNLLEQEQSQPTETPKKNGLPILRPLYPER